MRDQLQALSKYADPLEVLQPTADFEGARAWLVEGLGYRDGAKGGRPPFDPVMMFKGLLLLTLRPSLQLQQTALPRTS